MLGSFSVALIGGCALAARDGVPDPRTVAEQQSVSPAALSEASPSSAKDSCSLDRLALCSSINELVRDADDALPTRVREFLGEQRGDYNVPGWTAAENVLAALGGPPDSLEKLQGGGWLISACRHRSCDEKAAVLFEHDRIAGIGLVHYRCADECALEEPVLTIFARPNEVARAEPVLSGWAEAKLRDTARGGLSAVEVEVIE